MMRLDYQLFDSPLPEFDTGIAKLCSPSIGSNVALMGGET